MLGPLCYPLVPRMLDKSLAPAGAGIGVDVSRQDQLALQQCHALENDSVGALSRIDAACSLRLHILLIADDQILPESSMEKFRVSARMASEWASSVAQNTM